ncbi:MAG TPA: NUDIX domain-containing protein [Candidatus Saccharimonadales bacterium]|jgi:8-oxo-dGTP diphosphatase|nr:NUDIX domain-containing protein [Candidatus Saccharimonadales bacterium]
MNTYKTTLSGREVVFTHQGTAVMPPFDKVTSVSAIVFTTDGQIVAVRLRHRGIDIPGGHVEKYETTPLETLTREVMEEAHMTIRSPQLIEVIHSDFHDSDSYMLLYAALVDTLHEFKQTDEMSYERVMLGKEDFLAAYTSWDRQLFARSIDKGWAVMQKLI